MTEEKLKTGAENPAGKGVNQIPENIVDDFNKSSNLIQDASEGVLKTRDFGAFLNDNPEVNEFVSSRIEAMQIGDQITMPMWKFASWVNRDKVLSEKEAEKTVKQNIKGIIFESLDPEMDIDTPITVTINKIEGTNILLSGGGIQKEVDASLFYNYYKPNDITSLKQFSGRSLVGVGDVIAHDGSIADHGGRRK